MGAGMPASIPGLCDLSITTLLSSERPRIATSGAVLLSKAATFEGYTLIEFTESALPLQQRQRRTSNWGDTQQTLYSGNERCEGVSDTVEPSQAFRSFGNPFFASKPTTAETRHMLKRRIAAERMLHLRPTNTMSECNWTATKSGGRLVNNQEGHVGIDGDKAVQMPDLCQTPSITSRQRKADGLNACDHV